MDMKINVKFVKQERNARLWSQEQLAEISGLSPRTVQRIESSGNASSESVKSLASAFNCDSEQLVLPESYETNVEYAHSQFGLYIHLFTLFIWLMVCLPALSELSNSAGPEQSSLYWAFGITTVVTSVISILLFNLTVKVKKDQISWYFGPKFWRKSLAISDVVECKVVKNSLFNGFGIRDIGTGWLYNVSGLLAVEIKLKSGSVIRLGTNEPEYLKNAIDSALLQNF